MVKPLAILEKMHPDDIFASNIIGKYENQPDNLHSVNLADFAPSYVSKEAGDVPVEPDEIKSYSCPISNTDDVELNPNIIVLKNELGKMWKCSQPSVIRFCKVSKLESPEEHYLRHLVIYALEE